MTVASTICEPKKWAGFKVLGCTMASIILEETKVDADSSSRESNESIAQISTLVKGHFSIVEGILHCY